MHIPSLNLSHFYTPRKLMPLNYPVHFSLVSKFRNYLHIAHHFYSKHWNLLDKITITTLQKKKIKADKLLQIYFLILYNIHLAPLWLLTNHFSPHPSGEMRTVWDLLLSAVA